MQTLNINLPDGVNLSEKEILTAVATRLYDTGLLNLEQAADVAGYQMAAFIEELTAQSIQELPVGNNHH
jgi:predicted HTH domain antitoxin